MIVRQSPRPSGAPPLLFVHGAWHAAWCWDEHFLPFFTERGYSCYAPSLRGHGGSPGRDRLRTTRLREFVDDIDETAAQLPHNPVLVGHSMGGFLVQKYLERHSAAGSVLLAPIPPSGALATALRVLRRNPVPFARANLTLSLGPLVSTPELVRDLLFSASTPEEQVQSVQRRLQDESYLAFLELVAVARVRTQRVGQVPMLVLGAQNDTLVSPPQLRRTAAAYRAETQFFSDMGHDMMLEAGWRAVADRILGWLRDTFPDSSTGSRSEPAP